MNRRLVEVVVVLAMIAGLVLAPIVPAAVEGQAAREPCAALALGDAGPTGWDYGPATGT